MFSLQFRLEREGEDDYIVRSHVSYSMTRSVSTDITLDPGTYSVLMKITAIRNSREYSPEEVVTQMAKESRNKLLQIGLSYDLAHAKAHVQDEQRKKEHAEWEEREKALRKQKRRDQAEAKARKEWSKQKKLAARRKREDQKAMRAHEKRAAKQQNGRAGAENVTNGFAHRVSEFIHDTPADGDNSTWAQCDVDSGVGFSPELVQGTEEGAKVSPKEESKAFKRDSRTGERIPQIYVEDEAPAAPANGMRISWNGSSPSLHKTAPSEPEDDSDSDSFRDFEFDSEIDMPSDEEDDEPLQKGHGPPVRGPTSDICDGDNEEDPWNAVCVVGLRVYSHDPELGIGVVHPKEFDMGEMEAALDRDDPASAATQGR
jgi:hypothetical protein